MKLASLHALALALGCVPASAYLRSLADYRMQCGACDTGTSELTCDLGDGSSAETVTCECPADCPLAESFSCDVDVGLLTVDTTFPVVFADKSEGSCRFHAAGGTTECFRQCPRERKLYCDACSAAGETCRLADEGGVIASVSCDCDDDCTTAIECDSDTKVAPGNFPIIINGDPAGSCKPHPDDALSVICAETCPAAVVECSDCDSNEKRCEILVEGASTGVLFYCTCDDCVADDVCNVDGIDFSGYSNVIFPDGCSFSPDRQTLTCPGECPTPQPTANPTPQPTASPTPQPTPSPTPQPTASPTPQPTDSPAVCEDSCDRDSGGSCCAPRSCVPNRQGRYSCKRN
mmetsp:Transcript_22199/g.46826  ORF Transcript_22199/g.46826 Transcript_22199/m.46826 type:complete len:347 (-) Transcript_22199:248-1288(-)